MQEMRVQFLGWKILWRRKWEPTLVFLPGRSHGQNSLANYGPWGCNELDTTWLLNNNNSKVPVSPPRIEGWYVGSENLLRWSVLSACLWIQVHRTAQLDSSWHRRASREQHKVKKKVLAVQSCLTLRPHGLYPTRLLCPWDSPGKNTGVGSHSLLQGIFLTWGSNPGLLHCRQILYHLSHNTWLIGRFFPYDRRWETSESTTWSRQMSAVGGRYSTFWGGTTCSTLRMKHVAVCVCLSGYEFMQWRIWNLFLSD